jgi:hypothetical protein
MTKIIEEPSDTELVGMNATLQRNTYTDDYLIALNTVLPLTETVRPYVMPALERYYSSFARFESDQNLDDLVTAATTAGKWVAIERTPEQKTQILAADTLRYGHLTRLEGKMYLVPSLYFASCIVGYAKSKTTHQPKTNGE